VLRTNRPLGAIRHPLPSQERIEVRVTKLGCAPSP
jgi:hypothetical protein